MRVLARIALVAACIVSNPATSRVEAGFATVKPDLRIISAKPHPTKGSWMRIVVGNYGYAPAGECVLRTYAYTILGLYAAEATVPPLAASTGFYVPKVTIDMSVNAWLQNTYYVTCEVDFWWDVEESNENNNIMHWVNL